jgi:hypothetical protein
MYEGGIRIPSLGQWKGGLPAGEWSAGRMTRISPRRAHGSTPAGPTVCPSTTSAVSDGKGRRYLFAPLQQRIRPMTPPAVAFSARLAVGVQRPPFELPTASPTALTW